MFIKLFDKSINQHGFLIILYNNDNHYDFKPYVSKATSLRKNFVKWRPFCSVIYKNGCINGVTPILNFLISKLLILKTFYSFRINPRSDIDTTFMCKSLYQHKHNSLFLRNNILSLAPASIIWDYCGACNSARSLVRGSHVYGCLGAPYQYEKYSGCYFGHG